MRQAVREVRFRHRRCQVFALPQIPSSSIEDRTDAETIDEDHSPSRSWADLPPSATDRGAGSRGSEN
jgi:hypothetical protein